MPCFGVFLLVTVVALNAAPALFGQGPQVVDAQAAAQERCKARFAIEPLDPSVLKLLGSAVAPANPSLVMNVSFQQLRNWDLPAQVTRWSERPSPEELARRREALVHPPSSGAKGDGPSKKTPMPLGISAAYE
jgi:hypothetical protein